MKEENRETKLKKGGKVRHQQQGIFYFYLLILVKIYTF